MKRKAPTSSTISKKRKTTKKKSAFKDLSFLKSFPIKDKWYYDVSNYYMVFSPYGKDSPCETVGIDVGRMHLGISGLVKREYRKLPVTTWMSLFSVSETTVHAAVDKMVPILMEDENFQWFRNADYYRIELQMQENASARMVALALRTLCIAIHINAGKKVDVEFVHGDLKYSIAPIYSEDAKEDPLRSEYISGHSNTQKRKILGEHDVRNMMKENDEKNTLLFLDQFSNYVDQLFDMTDANLIGRAKYEKDLKSIKKKKK